ncbi:protein APEM9 [Asparagus officinalis]|nr:protein APEM9 [Asparagus officinalis]
MPMSSRNRNLRNKSNLSESYMVCCMFGEAASLAASTVKRVHNASLANAADDAQLVEMMESAGMVFVQSLKELGRTSELFGELKELFGTLEAIPVLVFLTGVCMQISEGYSSNLSTTLEEFLEKWVYLKDEVDVLPKSELQDAQFEGCRWQASIPLEKYLEVADIYAITILGRVLHKPDVAVSWTERAGLPEEKRQDMLRKLHSLHLSAHSSSSTDRSGGLSISGTCSAAHTVEKASGDAELPDFPNGHAAKPSSLRSIKPSTERISDKTFGSKVGNFLSVLPRRKTMMLGSFILFVLYILRKKHAVWKRFIIQQGSSIRRALIDAWQLAFSVQVNPLAAVQQLPSATPRGGR